jgi:dCMP deaminase
VFRPNIDEYFLNICLVLRERAACLKEAVGSIIVNDRSIISTGYNGTPRGTVNCYNGGCLVCNNSEKMGTEVLSCRCIHAEYNCILTAGITATRGGILYSTKLPCLWCAKLIIQGGISKVIYLRSYYSSLEYENAELVKKTFASANVLLLPVDMPSRN